MPPHIKTPLLEPKHPVVLLRKGITRKRKVPMVQEDWKGKQTRHHQRNLQVDHESLRKLGVDEAIGSFLLQQRKHHFVKDLLSKEETCCKAHPQRKEDMPCTLFQLTTMFQKTGRKNVHENCVGLFGLKGLFHRGKGVPLKGPFFAHFSQGNFGKVNEIVLFRVFRIFWYFDPASLGHSLPFIMKDLES